MSWLFSYNILGDDASTRKRMLNNYFRKRPVSFINEVFEALNKFSIERIIIFFFKKLVRMEDSEQEK